MQGADALFVVAEVSIGLAGFSGIVAALYARSSWHPLDKWRTVSLLMISFVTLGLALLTFGLYSLGIDGSTLWRAASAVAVAISIPSGVIGLRLQPPVTSIPNFSVLGQIYFGVASLIILAHLLNLLAIMAPSSLGVFYLALVASLMLGAMEFTHIILIRPIE